jgi:hypothetical protein
MCVHARRVHTPLRTCKRRFGRLGFYASRSSSSSSKASSSCVLRLAPCVLRLHASFRHRRCRRRRHRRCRRRCCTTYTSPHAFFLLVTLALPYLSIATVPITVTKHATQTRTGAPIPITIPDPCLLVLDICTHARTRNHRHRHRITPLSSCKCARTCFLCVAGICARGK